jgi:hypothetical protein
MPLNITQLAKVLGTTRHSLAAWMKRPDAPRGMDVQTWRTYVERSGLGAAGPKVAQSSASLRDQKTAKEVELLDLKIAKEKRKLIPAEDVDRLHLFVATRAKSKLYQSLETEAPPKLDGLSAAEQRPILRGIADSIADEMADLFAEFNKQ